MEDNDIGKFNFFDEYTNEFIEQKEMSFKDAKYYVIHNNVRMELVE